MQTKGATSDPECELNITLFLALPHPSPSLICDKDIMIIVLLLHLMEEMGRLKGASFMLGLGGGREQGVVIIFFLFFFPVIVLLIVVSWLVHDSLLCLLNCFCFAFFVSSPFN